MKNTPFYKKVISERYQRYNTKEYWKLFFDGLINKRFTKAAGGRGNFDNVGLDRKPMPEEVVGEIIGWLPNQALDGFSRTCQHNFVSCERYLERQKVRHEIKELLGDLIELKAGTYIMGPEVTEPPYLLWTRMPVTFEYDFLMGKAPVTQKQYKKIMGLSAEDSLAALKVHVDKEFNESVSINWLYDDKPMVWVTLTHIEEYLAALNARLRYLWPLAHFGADKPLLEVRLPTEFEWEYMTTEPLQREEQVELADKQKIKINAKHTIYPGPSALPDDQNRLCAAATTKSGPYSVKAMLSSANSRGFVGLARGIFECTSSPYTYDPRKPPVPTTLNKTYKGSGWDINGPGSTKLMCRSSRRLDFDPMIPGYSRGFRIAATVAK